MQKKIASLTFADIVVLAIIFFGMATYASLQAYFASGPYQGLAQDLSINDLASYQTTFLQMASLAVAGLYLLWRKFDVSVLDWRINRYTLPLTLLLVVGAGLFADLYQYVHSVVWPEHYPAEEQNVYEAVRYTPELVITSLFNGFFEEIFFMGLVFAVKPKVLPYAVIFSLLVRFIFHTYQGLAGALTITTLGVSFWLFRRHIPYLVPFFLAHAVFDIWGLSVLGWLF